ncbi:hypothetical protein ABBQ32_003800 [Trebouxia sp. C0010 RCD-2024]
MYLQTAVSTYFWSEVELIVMNAVWLLLCGSMLKSLGAPGRGVGGLLWRRELRYASNRSKHDVPDMYAKQLAEGWV